MEGELVVIESFLPLNVSVFRYKETTPMDSLGPDRSNTFGTLTERSSEDLSV